MKRIALLSAGHLFRCAGIVFLGLVGSVASAQQIVLVKDNFALIDGRVAGSQLAGDRPEESYLPDVRWKSVYAGNTVFSSAGRIVQQVASSPMEGRITIGRPSGITTVSAQLYFAAEHLGSWASVGFTRSDTATGGNAWFSPNAASADTVLWMRIQNGQYLINTNGTSSSAIASGSIAGFAWSNPYIVALSFDPESLRTRLTISYYTELKVDTGWIDTGLSSADITAAGFHYEGLGTSGHTFVDNFLVTGYPPIPEASSIALLMAVSLFPLLILRRLLRKHRG